MRSHRRSGELVRTRSGRTRRIARVMSLRSSIDGVTVPSRYPSRNVTSVTPRTAAEVRCSASRIAGICSRGVPSNPPASPRVTSRYDTSMPADTQPATVPAAPKSTSSGWAKTQSTRLTSASGSADGGNPTSDELAPAGPQDQQGELGPVGAERVAVAVQDLLLAGQDQPGAARGDPGLADLAGDRGPFEPERDQRLVDLIEASAQVGDVRVRGLLGARLFGRGLVRLVGGGVQDGAVHLVLLGSVVLSGCLAGTGARKMPRAPRSPGHFAGL